MVFIPPPNNDASAPLREKRVVGSDQLGTDKDMFIKLMVAQLQNQDPTAPMDQKDMMAQMAQYGQVEQTQNMAKAMETLSLAQGVGLIGREVSYSKDVYDPLMKTSYSKEFTGVVDHVTQAGGHVKLVLKKPDGADDSVPAVELSPADVTKVV